MCLLNNDFRLHKLGYTTTPGEWAQAAIEVTKRVESEPTLFDEVTL